MMDTILGMVTPNMQQALASRLGESPQAVQSGLSAATAATVSALADKAGDSGFLNQVGGVLSDGTGQTVLANLPAIASGSSSGAANDVVNRFLPMIFGGQQNQVANGIAQYAGVSAGSGLGLLRMAIPLVLGHFAKMHSAGSLTASSLGNLLRSEAPNVQSYLPAGLLQGSPSVLVAGRTESVQPPPTQTRTEYVQPPPAQTRTEYVQPPPPPRTEYVPPPAPPPVSTTPRWLIPAAILGALLLGWWLLRSMNPTRAPVQTAANAVCQGDKASLAGNTALGDMVRVRLPNGEQLMVPARGVEGKMLTYFSNNPTIAGGAAGGSGATAGDTASAPTWFVFDRVRFDTGQANLQATSQEQLGCVAEILKVFPAARVNIAGYTDNSGDPAANVQLSQQRADRVMSQLVTDGVDPSHMSAKGYGEDNPVADNSTEEGRQQNRRIVLVVVPANTP